jgi:hypothetical protein
MIPISFLRTCAGVVLAAGLAVSAEGRTWTNHEGKQIEAEYVRLDGLKVILLMNGREFAVPLANLSDEDKQYVFQQQIGGKTAATPATSSAERTSEDASDDSESASESSSAESSTSRSSAAVAKIRSWKDDQGKTIRAKFIRVYSGNVVLMQGRKTVQCPIANLSLEDQDYLRELLTARGEGDLMPSPEQLAAARQRGSSEGGAAGYAASGYGGGYAPSTGSEPAGSAAMSTPGATPYNPESYSTGSVASSAPSIPDRPEPSSYTPEEYNAGNPSSGSSGYSGYGGSYPAHDATAGASSYGSSMTSGYPGSTEVASATPASSYTSGISPPSGPFTMGPTLETQVGGQTQIEYYCSSCGKPVPEHINDRCPHCGIRFDYVEQPDGSRKYNSHYFVSSIGGVIAVIIGVVIRVIIMARR